MRLNRYLTLSILAITSIFISSCDENESGVDIIQFEARFISEIKSNVITFNNLSVGAQSYIWDFGDNTSSTNVNPVKTYGAGGTYTITLTAYDRNGLTDSYQATYIIEDIFDGGLVMNGDFDNGSEDWLSGVGSDPAPVVTVDGDTYYEVNITNPNPDQPFLVNLSQKLEIIQDNTYVLTFDAWSNTSRTLIAGIGLSSGSFANDIEIVNITDTRQQYSITLSSAGFGASDARVLFDSNGDAGFVRIDNVSLFLQ